VLAQGLKQSVVKPDFYRLEPNISCELGKDLAGLLRNFSPAG
jgi:hypothetical protein